MTQYARPSNDVSLGNWQYSAGSDLTNCIDDVDPGETDYIWLNNSASSACEVNLASVTDPLSSSNHVVHLRCKKTGTGTISLGWALECLGSVIASGTVTLTTSYADTDVALSTAEADAITNYGALSLVFTGVANSSSRYVYVCTANFNCPDASLSPVSVNFTTEPGITVGENASVQYDLAISKVDAIAVSENRVVNGLDYYSIRFNGSTTYINAGSDASIDNLPNASFTVELWIRMHETPFIAYGLIGKVIPSSTMSAGWHLETYFSDNILMQVFDGTGNWAYTRTQESVPLDAWTHITMAWNSTTKKSYIAINGTWCTYKSQDAMSSTYAADATYDMIIGAWHADVWQDFFDGRMSWIRISSGARYTVGSNFTPPDRIIPPIEDGTTVEMWLFDDGTGTTATAEVNSANNGTITDGAWLKDTDPDIHEDDSVAVSESAIARCELNVSQSESAITVGENIGSELLLEASLLEAAITIDETTTEDMLIEVNQAEAAITVGESVNAEMVTGPVGVSSSESAIAIGESAAVSVGLTVSTSQNISVGENAAPEAPAADMVNASKQDSITVTDAARYYQDNIIVVDHAAIEVVTEAGGDLSVSESESITVGETVAARHDLNISKAEAAIAVGETVTARTVLSIEDDDQIVNVAESVAARPGIEINRAESAITISEYGNVLVVTPGEAVISVSEGVSITETVAARPEINISKAETAITVGDTVTARPVIGISKAEAAITIGETVTARPTISISKAETAISVGETTSVGGVVLPLSASEAISVSEARLLEMLLEVSRSETVTLAEAYNISTGADVAGGVRVTDDLAHAVSAVEALYHGLGVTDADLHAVSVADVERV